MGWPAYQPAGRCTNWTPPGSIQFMEWAIRDFGQGARNLGIYNCLAAETKVLTRDGWLPISELRDSTAEVLTTGIPGQLGRWVEASIHSYGEQSLMKVTLSRDGIEKAIYATPEHRWFAAMDYTGAPVKEVPTTNLAPGMKLSSITPQSVATRTSPSPIGVQAGLVFGDGTKASHDGRIMLCGEKNEALLSWFSEMQPRSKNEVGTLVTGLPKSFKDAPSLDEGTSYLYGWLAGYLAADGSVGKTGSVTLFSSKRENLELVRKVALSLGIVTREITSWNRKGYLDKPELVYQVTLDARSLDSDFFLIESHRERWNNAERKRASRWKVVEVQETDRFEEVFCAEVPGTENFAIEDFILTGNCRDVRGSTNNSVHGEGRAVDVGFSGVANPAGTRLLNLLLPHVGALGIQMIIWNRRIYSARYPKGAPYTGLVPHTDHLHIELTWNSARNLTREYIRRVVGGVTPKPTPAPAPAPTPAPAPDWQAIRRWNAGLVYNDFVKLPNLDGSSPPSMQIGVLQNALNIVRNAGLKVDGQYGGATMLQVLAFQQDVNKLKPGTIKDFPGAAHDGTRWMLGTALANIRDGKA